MRLGLTVAAAGGAGDAEVVVDLGAGVSVRAVADAVGRALGRPCAGLWLADERLDPQARALDVLVEGARVALDGPLPAPAPHDGPALHVVAGPDAGRVLPVPPEGLLLGRAPGTAGLRDREVSRRHARVRVQAGDLVVRDLASTNGTSVDGQRAEGEVALPEGAHLRVGASVLAVAPAVPALPVRPGGLVREVSRPPRLVPPREAARVVLPEPPGEEDERGFPFLLLLVPLVAAGLLALVVGPRFLLFGLLGPAVLVASWASDRSSGRARARRAGQRHAAATAAAEHELAGLLDAEGRARRNAHPDPAVLRRTASGPGTRLWERRRDDPDALEVRLGLGRLPARVALVHPRGVDGPPPEVPDVPVVVPLREVGVLGLAGPRGALLPAARWVLGQLAVLHPPADLAVVVLADPLRAADWTWAARLPHSRPADGRAHALVGLDAATVAARVTELAALVREREAGEGPFPAVLVVLDGARALRAQPGVAALLADGPPVGVHLLCLEDDERRLPQECGAVLALAPPGGRLTRRGRAPVEDVLVDGVGPGWADEVSRALAGLRDATPAGGVDGLPSSARLLDVLDLEPLDAHRVASRWRARPRSTAFALGLAADGPLVLDLERHGPHGLVAGTTGSGKSELLQAVVASLAVANRPDELCFVLVDYKGGSAFAEAARLPHVVGMVTDLDATRVARALASLDAEFDRRQRVLRDAAARTGLAVPDLRAHQALRDRGLVDEPLARLVLVVDEFAALVDELPGSVDRLVDLAARGRSVGMHLLLATQSPSGVVSPAVRANTALRIALRTTSTAESSDVLDAPDAAALPRSAPGRALVRLGPGELVPVQAGRVSGPRPGAVPLVEPEPWARVLTPSDLGLPPPARPLPPVARQDETDLSALVDAVTAAARQLGVAPPPRPWLPPLPDALLLDGLRPPPGGRGPVLPYGLLDLPERQAQVPAVLDLDAAGHLLVVGGPGTGRTQLLRALAASAAVLSPGDVQLHVLDGGGALHGLAGLPHCGAVVQRAEPERGARLLARLTAEVGRRAALLAAAGHASVAEQRAAAAPGERLPHLLLLLDRWEALALADDGLLDALLPLLREGPSAGLHVVLTGDRSLVTSRAAALVDDVVALRLPDRADYALLGLRPRDLPDDLPPGRAVRAADGALLQVALLAPDPGGRAQADALARLAVEATHRDEPHPPPLRVDVLPAALDLAGLHALRPAGAGGWWVPLAAGGDELSALGPDLASGPPGFVVAGPPGSGRSTALAVLARGLHDAGVRVVLGLPRPSPPLEALEGLEGLGVVVLRQPPDAVALAEALGDGPAALLVDDAEDWRDAPVAEALRALASGGPGPRRALVLAGHVERVCAGLVGWQVDVRRAGRGLLLSPRAVPDGDLVGLRLPRSAVGGPVLPGRGLLHLGDGRAVAVQVPRAPLPGPAVPALPEPVLPVPQLA